MKINLLKKAKRLSKFILNDLESKLLLKEEIDPKLKESYADLALTNKHLTELYLCMDSINTIYTQTEGGKFMSNYFDTYCPYECIMISIQACMSPIMPLNLVVYDFLSELTFHEKYVNILLDKINMSREIDELDNYILLAELENWDDDIANIIRIGMLKENLKTLERYL